MEQIDEHLQRIQEDPNLPEQSKYHVSYARMLLEHQMVLRDEETKWATPEQVEVVNKFRMRIIEMWDGFQNLTSFYPRDGDFVRFLLKELNETWYCAFKQSGLHDIADWLQRIVILSDFDKGTEPLVQMYGKYRREFCISWIQINKIIEKSMRLPRLQFPELVHRLASIPRDENRVFMTEQDETYSDIIRDRISRFYGQQTGL